MEAFVDVEGCILCFEGIGDVRPGVSDNLTEENKQGTLLANVELERYYEGKSMTLSNIYYDLNKAEITSRAAEELDKVATFLNDNPQISVELSSHTDSRGGADFNLDLSQRRSLSAVEYLTSQAGVLASQIVGEGYGETKIINGCTDGVKCSEEEHALNRRTELLIINTQENIERKSLVQMKREEKFESMLNELEFGSQIRVGADEDLEKYIKDKSQNEPSRVFEDLDEEGEALSEVLDKSNMTNPKEMEDGEILDIADAKKENSSHGVMNNPSLEGYNGYKLVIHFSRFPLPEEHSIYEKNEGVLDYITVDQNHLYMVGDFEQKEDAEKYLKSELLEEYPNAYLVGFREGVRVE
jgi:outer membrane protein OmpA-like peptidoglycan-associated protein